ncbi:hypothetical protein BDW74DRAFT_80222 [Aspergillus multicolor]|uniref:uncharacterized protein n=1 Tax=Aspergillus multicolor TaxID=41759 RepID=UPI003CCD4048
MGPYPDDATYRAHRTLAALLDKAYHSTSESSPGRFQEEMNPTNFGDDGTFDEIVADLQTDTKCLADLDALYESPVSDWESDEEDTDAEPCVSAQYHPIGNSEASSVRSQSTPESERPRKRADEQVRHGAVPPNNVSQSPATRRIPCSLCNDQIGCLYGEQELRRHIERVHTTRRKVWICVDISQGKTFLASCKACRNGKRYSASYNAAAHLRRTHFHQARRGRTDFNKKDARPPMDILKHWMMEQEEFVVENAGHTVGIDEVIDWAMFAESAPGPEREGLVRSTPSKFTNTSPELRTNMDTAPAPHIRQRDSLPVNGLA